MVSSSRWYVTAILAWGILLCLFGCLRIGYRLYAIAYFAFGSPFLVLAAYLRGPRPKTWLSTAVLLAFSAGFALTGGGLLAMAPEVGVPHSARFLHGLRLAAAGGVFFLLAAVAMSRSDRS